MSKINVTHFAGVDTYLYAIDDQGRIWRRHFERDTWTRSGELPDQPGIRITRGNDEPKPAVVDVDGLDLTRGTPEQPHDVYEPPIHNPEHDPDTSLDSDFNPNQEY